MTNCRFHRELVCLTGIAAGLLILFSLPNIASPLVIDEATFIYGARGIAQTGAPYFYNGEFRPTDLAMWHPPAYVYSLGLWLSIFGGSIISARLFGLLIVAVAIAVVAQTMSESASCEASAGDTVTRRRLIQGSVILILATNPLIVSGMLVPDIDGTLGVLLAALSLRWATRTVRDTQQPRLLHGPTVFLVSALVLTKWTLLVFLAPGLLLAALLGSGLRGVQNLLVNALFAITGSAAFYYLLAAWAQFPASAPFQYFASGSSRIPVGIAELGQTVINNAGLSTPVLFFITPGLVVAAVVGYALGLSRVGRRAQSLVGVVFASATFFGHAILSASPFGFPKYWGVTVVFLSAAAVTPLVELASRWGESAVSRASNVSAWVSLGVVSVAVSSWKLSGLSEAPNGRSGTILIRPTIAMVIVTAGVATVAVAVANARSKGLRWMSRPRLIDFYAVLLIGVVSTAAIVSVQLRDSEVSTRYYPHEYGLREQIIRLVDVSGTEDTVIAPKDIGLQSGRRFYEDSFLFLLRPSEFEREMRRLEATFFVTRKNWDYSDKVFPAHHDRIGQFYRMCAIQVSRDFELWVNLSDSQNRPC